MLNIMKILFVGTQLHFRFVKKSAATFILLNGRAFCRTIRTIHTAISLFWFQNGMAIFTFIKELARIHGHGFFLLKVTIWTAYY